MSSYYSRELTEPKDMAEGLQNFVQMIVNQIEAGEHHSALMLAVDLLDDLRCGTYKEVTAPDLSDASVPMSEHLRAVEAARREGMEAGMKAGGNAVRSHLRNLLQDAA